MTDAELDAIEAGAKKRMRDNPPLRELWALEWILEMAEEIRGRSKSLRENLRVVKGGQHKQSLCTHDLVHVGNTVVTCKKCGARLGPPSKWARVGPFVAQTD